MLSSVLPFFFFTDTATPEIYTLSLHDALPISRHFEASRSRAWRVAQRRPARQQLPGRGAGRRGRRRRERSEEHTSELQSHSDLVCRLLLEKKKKKKKRKEKQAKKGITTTRPES